MIIIKLELTNKELRALKEIIDNGNPCSGGCVYEEMTNSKKDCGECEFTHSVNNISDKAYRL